MAIPLKLVYTPQFFSPFLKALSLVIPHLNTQDFLNKVYDASWHEKALKERFEHLGKVLSDFLSDDFQKTSSELIHLIEVLDKMGVEEASFEFMFIPEVIRQNGLKYQKASIKAMERVTQFTSCEFAIRPFIVKYQNMTEQLLNWCQHPSEKVRRLASEGCRPRLPWACSLPHFKKDPSPIFPILEALRQDVSPFVRRSVANNLNDISKEHPDKVLLISKQWLGSSKETNLLLKHGCRTLLKQGNKEALSLFGQQAVKGLYISNFELKKDSIPLGGTLSFTFSIVNKTDLSQNIRTEYALYYLRQGGKQSKKIFKIGEQSILAQSTIHKKKQQIMKDLSVRKLYRGNQQIEIILNGVSFGKRSFQII